MEAPAELLSRTQAAKGNLWANAKSLKFQDEKLGRSLTPPFLGWIPFTDSPTAMVVMPGCARWEKSVDV